MAGESTAKATVISMKCQTADITKKYLLKINPASPDYVLHPSAIGECCIGIAMDSADISEGDIHVPVGLLTGGGTFVGVSSTSVTAGALLMSDAEGKLITYASSGTRYIVGIAMETVSGADKDLLFAPFVQKA